MGTQIGLTGVVFGDGTTQNTAITTSGGNYVMNTYTSPTTWTKPAGLKGIKVTVVGGGGNAGPAYRAFGAPSPKGTPNTGVAYSGGGGGGGISIIYMPAPAVPGPITVTVGTGANTSSFGTFATATGGTSSANTGGTPSPTALIGTGGTGGSGSVSLPAGSGFSVQGTDGFPGTQSVPWSQYGGTTLLGSIQPAPGTTTTGRVYGGGAPGVSQAGSTPGPANLITTGGAGAAGIVLVEEFY